MCLCPCGHQKPSGFVVKDIIVQTDAITLNAFLKWAGISATGGGAKALIQSGAVVVNGEVEKHRNRKLSPGDVVAVSGEGEFRLCSRPSR